jgi:hypothetical protein
MRWILDNALWIFIGLLLIWLLVSLLGKGPDDEGSGGVAA